MNKCKGVVLVFIIASCSLARGQDVGTSEKRWTAANKESHGKWGIENKDGTVTPLQGYTRSLGAATSFWSDKTIRNIYHEKFQYVDGILRILTPMVVIDATPQAVTGTKQVGEGYAATGTTRTLILAKPVPQAEGDPPKSICNTNTPNYTPNIALLQIVCVDYDALKLTAPNVPWPTGKRTQVLIHARAGDAMRVTLGGGTAWADLTPHPDGVLHGMVQFEGIGHAALPEIKVLAEVK